MKNIHILLTSQPSRLQLQKVTKELLLYKDSLKEDAYTQPIDMFITSDKEIKDGDWYFDGTDFIYKKTKYNDALVDGNKQAKKVILTTDQSLIQDGVQDIPDEFLEWFVKNPSCKEIKVNILKKGIYDEYKYKIIIPKEESKQETVEEASERTEFERYGETLTNYTKQRPAYNLGFNNGAKWQAEKMYSEEDMINAWNDGNNQYSGIGDAETYLEQFKK